MATETVEQVKERLAQQEADRKAEQDAKLAAFDREMVAKAAKKAADQQAEQAAREKKQQAEAAAKFDRQHKEPAKLTWLTNGGTLAEFEEAWPQLRIDKLAELSGGKEKVREQWQRSAARRYR